MTTPTKPPWRPLWERVAGKTGERELVEDVPDYLEPVLFKWVLTALREYQGLATSVQLRLRRTIWVHPTDQPRGTAILDLQGKDLLEAIDVVLATNVTLLRPPGRYMEWEEQQFRKKWVVTVKELHFRLIEAGSAWQPNAEFDGLERRVDETVAEAAKATIAAAPTDAATHLKAAWAAAYAFHPDPEKAYSQAIKAAEAVVIPATIPNAGTPTLGTALKHLEDTKAKWTTVLDDKNGNPASAEPVIGLIRMLWQGQRDRHAGGPTSKPATQEAAEAAVHAAVLIVQWFNSKAVVKNP
ncbi:hypothetical protein ABT352_32965 [Streptosporangium sp. NPDC000563]|uniref:hypothetical protein n=1 Tax=Streptosporangium sp. NPDC000563 TaxID=3154366 RepID=UPI003324CCBC